ncbi:ABC transporter transmembrane domain-containing protein [Microbispora amethystogenes]|uniref:ABC transporter ATP-binding protein n=1 Tax=Microbispora amethystogenes TaxID=1427754 RepID=A0ABQ4FMJ9_9ACTN|nr:ABC transporter ATP-binding protein [Microbispora amethystogenes]
MPGPAPRSSEEQVSHGHGDRLIAALSRDSWMPLAATATGSIATTAVALALPAALAAAVNAVVTGRGALTATAYLALLLAGAALAEVATGITSTTATASAIGTLRLRVAGHLLSADVSGATRFSTGELVNRLVSNTATAGSAPVTLLGTLTGVAASAGAVVALFAVDPRAGLAFLAGTPVLVVVLRVFVSRVSGLYDEYQSAQGRLAARLTETLAGIRTVRAAGTASREIDRVLRPLADLSSTGHALWRAQSRTVWQIMLLMPLVEILVLAVAGLGVAEGRLTPGALVAVAGYAALGLTFVEQIDPLLGLAYGRSAAVRVLEVLALPVLPAGRRRLPDGPGALSFRGVTVTRGDARVLDDVDLEIPAGALTAVVGRSGAGKTTLAMLAGRLTEPDRGRVLLDGLSLSDLEPGCLRDAVAYAFERPALLGGDIASAIAYGTAGTTREAVRAAARAAEVDDVVSRLPLGYDTPSAGAPLSGGEIQRLGLARALLRRARLTILDDATSGLDTVTEAQVTRTLVEGMRGRTRLVVAHRPATAARADLVIWLEAGRVRGRGTHRELWRHRDYRDLFAPDAPDSRGEPHGGEPAGVASRQEASCPR